MTRVRGFRVVGTALILALAAAGCRHAPAPVVPPQSTAPPVQPGSITHVPTLPPVPEPHAPKVGPPGTEEPAKVAEAPPPPKRVRRRKHPIVATETATATAAPPATGSTSTAGSGAGTAATAASTVPGAATAAGPGGGTAAAAPEPSLGQLSAGNGADSKERAATTDEIRAQETRLGSIRHPLSQDAEATAVQIRAFLGKARQAALDNDLDGARTLTMKAKVLLDELTGS